MRTGFNGLNCNKGKEEYFGEPSFNKSLRLLLLRVEMSERGSYLSGSHTDVPAHDERLSLHSEPGDESLNKK